MNNGRNVMDYNYLNIKGKNTINNNDSNIKKSKSRRMDNEDLIIDDNTIYEIDRKCFERYIDRKIESKTRI
ncbi:MAG TPA: hypothetical protein GXZ90_00490 [Clostridiales bacterium]|nr:hypothetical protein [Clostridiales bacterium]